MKQRISVNLKVDQYKQLQTRAAQSGRKVSALVRLWLKEYAKIEEIKLKRVDSESEKTVSYNIFLEENLIAALDKTAKELGVPRNTFIASVIDSHLNRLGDLHKPQQVQNVLENTLDDIPPDLSLDELVDRIVNTWPFLGKEVSTGLFVREGNTLRFIGFADYYDKRGVTRLLPMPYRLIQFNLSRDKNVATSSLNSKSIQVTTHLREIVAPLLMPAVWDRIEHFIDAKLYAAFPLLYKSQACGVLIVSFSTPQLDLELMSTLEAHARRAGEILGKKLEDS